jgi:hypothetical protein
VGRFFIFYTILFVARSRRQAALDMRRYRAMPHPAWHCLNVFYLYQYLGNFFLYIQVF